VESIPWSEETEVERIAEFDVGIMPVPDEPFERGKCGYKLIQYMASRKPVIASPVGVNRNIVEQGTNGFLADTAGEWDASIEKLARSPAMRHAFGARGFEKVERMYSLRVWAPRVAELLRAACRG
jgi:glycosyltransferase involved in cell wall biosynthesis